MRWLPIAPLLAGFLVAGCGGDSRLSKDEYEKKFHAATQHALASGEKISAAPNAPPAQRAAANEKAAAVLKGLAGEIDGLKPPKEVDKTQDDFVAALRAHATEIDNAVAAFRRGDRKPLTTLDQSGGASRPVAEREAKALEEFKQKGYDVASTD